LSVGADGVILISTSKKADFKARFYNADGSLSRFCGNGSRCVSRYAFLNGIAGKTMSFEGEDGIHNAVIHGKSVSVSIPDVDEYSPGLRIRKGRKVYRGSLIEVGVPHFVTETSNLENIDIIEEGRFLRFHRFFPSGGANIDFIRWKSHDSIQIRTYERGVEGETLACGSGCVAAALYASREKGFSSPIILITRSSIPLKVSFQAGDSGWKKVFLEGDARVIFKGVLHKEGVSGFYPQSLNSKSL
jgi:diaminopimelate epimerase